MVEGLATTTCAGNAEGGLEEARLCPLAHLADRQAGDARKPCLLESYLAGLQPNHGQQQAHAHHLRRIGHG